MLLEIWLKASSRKPMFIPSTIGRRPVIAAPTAMPVKLFSAIGVSRHPQLSVLFVEILGDLVGTAVVAHVLTHHADVGSRAISSSMASRRALNIVRVGQGMTPEPVGETFNQGGAFPGPGAGNGLWADGAHGHDIHAIHFNARHIKGPLALR
jgi:hypothetical protein